MVEWKGYEPNTPEAHAAAAAYEPPSWIDSTSDYVDKAISTVSGAVDSGWDFVNDLVDTYIWDTDSDVAKLEALLKGALGYATDFVTVPLETAIGIANAWIDEHIWDTGAGTGELEELVKEAAALVTGRSEVATTDYSAMLATFLDPYEQKVEEETQGVVDTVFNFIDDKLGNINLTIDFGFDWLAARLEDLLEIPAMAFFKFLAAVTQPPEKRSE